MNYASRSFLRNQAARPVIDEPSGPFTQKDNEGGTTEYSVPTF
jgi:hypothetical protein